MFFVGDKRKFSLLQKGVNQNRVMNFIATKLQNYVFCSYFICINYMPALKLLKTLSIFDDRRY